MGSRFPQASPNAGKPVVTRIGNGNSPNDLSIELGHNGPPPSEVAQMKPAQPAPPPPPMKP